MLLFYYCYYHINGEIKIYMILTTTDSYTNSQDSIMSTNF